MSNLDIKMRQQSRETGLLAHDNEGLSPSVQHYIGSHPPARYLLLTSRINPGTSINFYINRLRGESLLAYIRAGVVLPNYPLRTRLDHAHHGLLSIRSRLRHTSRPAHFRAKLPPRL